MNFAYVTWCTCTSRSGAIIYVIVKYENNLKVNNKCVISDVTYFPGSRIVVNN